jgi:hypothetical protein
MSEPFTPTDFEFAVVVMTLLNWFVTAKIAGQSSKHAWTVNALLNNLA